MPRRPTKLLNLASLLRLVPEEWVGTSQSSAQQAFRSESLPGLLAVGLSPSSPAAKESRPPCWLSPASEWAADQRGPRTRALYRQFLCREVEGRAGIGEPLCHGQCRHAVRLNVHGDADRGQKFPPVLEGCKDGQCFNQSLRTGFAQLES